MKVGATSGKAGRLERRERYIAGWYDMDLEKLLSATAPDFVFEDPAEPAPVTRAMLADYMARWQTRSGGRNDWILSHEVREDKDGILTDWEWWDLVGSGFGGAALVTTGDQGVTLERITYFTRGAG